MNPLTRFRCDTCFRRAVVYRIHLTRILSIRQALKDIDSNIELKEQLMSELSCNQKRFEQLREHYECEAGQSLFPFVRPAWHPYLFGP